MGMAASQARFLGLTARKTNTEYEGQQINQQRTALSNKSAAYYNDLLTMNVPTAPSAVDYTTTVYTFTDGPLSNQLTSMIALADGSFTVSYLRTYTDDHAIVSATPMIVTRDVDSTLVPTGLYRIGSDYMRELDNWNFESGPYSGIPPVGVQNSIQFAQYDSQDVRLIGGKFQYYNSAQEEWVDCPDDYEAAITDRTGIFSEGYYSNLTVDQIKGMSENEASYLAQLPEVYGGSDDEWIVRYVLNTTTNAYVPNFYDKTMLDNPDITEWNDNNRSKTAIRAFTLGSAPVTEEITGIHAYLEQDTTGRYTNITIENEGTYALSTNTITDSDAYKDAMNQYEYNKALYDKNIQEVNAKIEIIQAEDKNLELRLKQLDTEEKAIQAEIDAVSSVIKNNVDKSFKTFNA